MTFADPCTGARTTEYRSGADSPRGLDHGQSDGARVPPRWSGHRGRLVAPDESARSCKATPLWAVARRSRYVPLRFTSRDLRRASQEPHERGTGGDSKKSDGRGFYRCHPPTRAKWSKTLSREIFREEFPCVHRRSLWSQRPRPRRNRPKLLERGSRKNCRAAAAALSTRPGRLDTPGAARSNYLEFPSSIRFRRTNPGSTARTLPATPAAPGPWAAPYSSTPYRPIRFASRSRW